MVIQTYFCYLTVCNVLYSKDIDEELISYQKEEDGI